MESIPAAPTVPHPPQISPPSSRSPPALGIAHECQSLRRHYNDEARLFPKRPALLPDIKRPLFKIPLPPPLRVRVFHSPATVASALLKRKYDKCVPLRLLENGGGGSILFFPGANRWNGVNPGQVTGFLCVCV